MNSPVVLVTGALTGIGRATALAFAKAGARVAVSGRRVAEGPERIAMEWWRDETGQALTRDYFRLECRDGLRAWLYREGLFDRETPQPRWFLHGLFG